MRTRRATNGWVLGVACLLTGLLATGCGFAPEVSSLTEQEMLERQVLAGFDDLHEEVYSMASVRGVDMATGKPTPPAPVTESKKEALHAERSREFNRDDIESFKAKGYVGENNRGFLTFFPPQQEKLKKDDPKAYSLVHDVVGEENSDRLVLMKRVLETTPALDSGGGLGEIEKIFSSKNRSEAKPNEWIQKPGGEQAEWLQVSPKRAE